MKTILVCALMLAAARGVAAQDARSVLEAAAKAMGAQSLESIQYYGGG